MNGYDLPEGLQRHPLSQLFGDIEPEQFAELVEDIKKNGQRDIVAILDGKVLDGWHRYKACLEAGRKCIGRDFPPTADAVAYVESKNLRRRNYTASQRAAVVVKLRRLTSKLSVKNDDVCHDGTDSPVVTPPSAKEMAEAAKVSKRTIYRAMKAEEEGTLDDVIAGRTALRGEAISANPVSEADRMHRVIEDLEERLKAAALELEWYSMRELPESELANRCNELTRQVSTLESRLAEEMEKTAALTAKVRHLTKELNK